MQPDRLRTFVTPRESALGLRSLTNAAGLSLSVLPNGCVFSMEHRHERGRTLINRIRGAALDGGIGRIHLRLRAPERTVAEIVGPHAEVTLKTAPDRFVWTGETGGVRHFVTLWLHPTERLWLWKVELEAGDRPVRCDAILVQDIGLGDDGFVMNNEAYASQYVDHHVAEHVACGPVVMCRQNQRQSSGHPWVAHGCLDGAASFATDAMQLFGPSARDGARIDPECDLPGARLQHEAACPMIQSRLVEIEPNAKASLTFFALFEPDHPDVSGDADLARIDAAVEAASAFETLPTKPCATDRSILQDAPFASAQPLDPDAIDARYPQRIQEERLDGSLASFFSPDGAQNRHVALRDKELTVARRHGAILRTGQGMLLDETTLCATCWMQGVFASLLSIGNTSFHRLLSPARDPSNLVRSGGLRLMIDAGAGWELLGTPSAFEIGLSDCVWVYRLADRTVTVRAMASGRDPAMVWRVEVEGPPCRFLVLAGLVLGERELGAEGRVEIDSRRMRMAFRPDPESLWGQKYPDAVYHLAVDAPEAMEALGNDELLYADGAPRGGGHVAMLTRETTAFGFALVGSLTDPADAERLAAAYADGPSEREILDPARRYWENITRKLRIRGEGQGVEALDTLFPWLAHDAMIHLTTPHGLEQYSGAAWGTRDVCQGPVELLLALEHDDVVKAILRTVFEQQNETRGDWPQWFMVEPYASIRDRHSHGDVIVWPLKAVCDYIEATDDLGFLDELVAWRREADFEKTERRDTISAHLDKLLATVRERFVPGTSLICYGEGDWNDSLQPADPRLRDWMVSSWTVALLYQQLNRYAEVLARAGRDESADVAALARSMREDFNRHLVRDGIVAGYAVFDQEGGEPEFMLHPRDARTGLSYSLLPMTRSIISGMFTEAQAQDHLKLIREHLLFPDGARLMDRPVAYRGGLQKVFQRAESAAFFGREIGLQYVHAHLRYGEALAKLREADALWEALAVVNPVMVSETVANASPRQRNAYFSSSDAAFADRYEASAEWDRVRNGTVAVDGGWRIYSSGPGLYVNMLLSHALGLRRRFGERIVDPVLPASVGRVTVEWEVDGREDRWELGG